MAGSFASFNTALSALRYNRVVMDVASSNIANVGTEGYARRRVEGETVGAPAQAAMWSRHDGSGEGVRVGDLTRMADQFLDLRARKEHGSLSYLAVRQEILERVESGIGEPGDAGVAAALAEFRVGWHDLANNPSSDAARSQVLARSATLTDALRTQARQVTSEAENQRGKLLAVVSQVSTLASDLAEVNRSIAVTSFNETDTNALQDQRDLLALRLAQLTGAQASLRADGGYDVMVNGVSLVSGAEAGVLRIASGVRADGTADGAGVTFEVASAGGTTPVPGGLRGEGGAIADALSVTLPGYLAGLDEIARSLADEINAQHQQGYDRDGNAGLPLFGYDPASPAGSLAVALTSPDRLAASSMPGGVVQGDNADVLAGATSVEDSYQRLVNGFGSEVASTRRLAANQAALTSQVDSSREQLSGVSLDEEMVQMLAAQRAYEAASRVMTAVDAVLDTLINRTGLVGR